MFFSRIISSLEKCFIRDSIAKFEEIREISMLKNQHLSLQLVTTSRPDCYFPGFRFSFKLKVEGALAPYVKVRAVEQVPNLFPVYPNAPEQDGNYLSYEPGLYPDLLRPLHYGGDTVQVVQDQLRAYWIDVEPEGRIEAGTYPLTFTLTREVEEEGTIRTETVT